MYRFACLADSMGDCDSCRIIGAGVFYVSAGYMGLETLRAGSRGSKIFYAVCGMALGGLGTYRLLKAPASSKGTTD